MTEKTVDERYRKLDEISHVLLRPGRYIGSIASHTAEVYVLNSDATKMESRTLTYCPALLKVFDEVISNSVDFSKTADGKHVTRIEVSIDRLTGSLSIMDDGGIVVQRHKEYDQYIPELIFELRAGTNFDDTEDSTLAGQNGEGGALTNIFSREFNVLTSDGKNQFFQRHTDNSRTKTVPSITPSKKHFTQISWIPDYEKFGMECLDQDNFDRLVKRVYDVAACNTNLKVFINGTQIKIKNFQAYVDMFVDESVYVEFPNWKIGVAAAKDGFEHVSFVNGTETTIGGQHVHYITEQLVSSLREFFKKKHKVEVKPSEIRQHLMLFIDATIIRPRYSSQTKEDLITEIKNFGTSFEFPESTIKQILKSSVIKSVLDWVAAKEHAQLLAESRKLDKNLDKTNLRKIVKFTDATEKVNRLECMLFICEGDSANNSILSARTPMIGSYPLKGKPINAMDADLRDLMANKEFVDLLAVTGLKVGQKVTSPSDLRFGRLVSCSDQDSDGQHIFGLLTAMITKFWPEVIEMGMFYKFITPLLKVRVGKNELLFYTLDEFAQWEAKNLGVKYDIRYLKGLGSSTAKDFAGYFKDMEKHLIRVTIDSMKDLEVVDLVFGKSKGSADRRKVWLELEETL